MKVAIQGVSGAFHEVAARSFFGDNISIDPCLTFEDVVNSINQSNSDCGLMAIENTISGTILSNYNLIREGQLNIVGEINLRIEQNLGVLPGTNITELKVVSSHYMALNQCRKYFGDKKYIQLVEAEDTALSLKEISEQKDKSKGAIGSKLAIEQYGLELLGESIETDKQNFTRFAVLKKDADQLEFFDKVSLSVVLPHQPGALAKLLNLFDLLGINLTKIESTPVVGKPFQYRFYLDMILSNQVSFETTLEVLKPLTDEIQVLGTYLQNLEKFNQ